MQLISSDKSIVILRLIIFESIHTIGSTKQVYIGCHLGLIIYIFTIHHVYLSMCTVRYRYILIIDFAITSWANHSNS